MESILKKNFSGIKQGFLNFNFYMFMCLFITYLFYKTMIRKLIFLVFCERLNLKMKYIESFEFK